MTAKQQLEKSSFDLELSICKEVCEQCSEDIFDKSRDKYRRYDRSLYITAFADAIQFVANCRADGSAHIKLSTDRHGKQIYVYSLLAERFFMSIKLFATMLRCLSDQYHYHEYITVLKSCCQKIGLLDEDYYWSPAWTISKFSPSYPEAQDCVDTFNKLVTDVELQCRKTGAYRKYMRRRSEAENTFNSYWSYIAAIYNSPCARLIAIRLNLYYKTEIGQSVTLEMAQNDIDNFFNKRHYKCYKALFDGLKGFIRKTEYGINRGIHFHLLLLFDGSLRDGRRHIHLAKEIGEYWNTEITEGRGSYSNSNAQINNFKRLNRCGIGVVEYHHDDLLFNLKNHVLKYICKADQFIKPKLSQVKLITRGETPEISDSPRGRKRKKFFGITAIQNYQFINANLCGTSSTDRRTDKSRRKKPEKIN